MNATSKSESMSPKPCIALGLDHPVGITDFPVEILENIAEGLPFKSRTRFMRTHPIIHHKLAEYQLFDTVQNHLPSTIVGNVFDGRLEILKVLQSKGARFDVFYGSDNPRRYDPDFPLEHRRARIMLCGPDPEMRYQQTFQVLHLAILRGHDDIAAWLVHEVEVPVNEPCKGISSLRHSGFAPTGNAQTPLSLAIREKRPFAVKLLLKKGAALYTDSCTPVQLAVATGCRETVRVVLEHARCDIDAVNVVARTALSIAADISGKCVRLLVNAGASLTTECAFGSNPDWEQDWLIDRIHHVNRLLPFHIAAMNDDPEAVIALLEAGADVNRLSSGLTALHCALRNRHRYRGPRLETIKALLNAGADPNVMSDPEASVGEWTSISGVTQLMHAALESPFPEVIELLLHHGADAKAVDSNREDSTPLAPSHPLGCEALSPRTWASTGTSAQQRRYSQVDPLNGARTNWERHRLYFDRMHKLAARHDLFTGGLVKFFLRHAEIRNEGLRTIDRVAADYELNREYYDSNDGWFDRPDLWDYDEDDAAPVVEEEDNREQTTASYKEGPLHDDEEHRGDSVQVGDE
ncbi:ankyrin repeat-containing domain protein [Coniochaeta sp. 2T2.1]|nr:ankyrin repeat-containing domain protein [Coniochaeta sp. 2T2.1]